MRMMKLRLILNLNQQKCKRKRRKKMGHWDCCHHHGSGAWGSDLGSRLLAATDEFAIDQKGLTGVIEGRYGKDIDKKELYGALSSAGVRRKMTEAEYRLLEDDAGKHALTSDKLASVIGKYIDKDNSATLDNDEVHNSVGGWGYHPHHHD
jgi:hypothetical protein